MPSGEYFINKIEKNFIIMWALNEGFKKEYHKILKENKATIALWEQNYHFGSDGKWN